MKKVIEIVTVMCGLLVITLAMGELLPVWVAAVPVAALVVYVSVMWVRHVESYENKDRKKEK